jgi:hypothetical protein
VDIGGVSEMTSVYAPFAESLRAKALFPPAGSGYDIDEAWSKGYQDAQQGVKNSPYESGSDLDHWYNVGYDDGCYLGPDADDA